MKTMKSLFVVVSMFASLLFGELAYSAKGMGHGDKGETGMQVPAETGKPQHGMESDAGYQDDDNARNRGEAGKGKKDRAADGAGSEPKGREMQQEKKMNQERKELGQGSEQGQQKREEHSRKWWRFWE